jgi:multidrug efflux pump subunit AcrA (membrane-fusion protein)
MNNLHIRTALLCAAALFLAACDRADSLEEAVPETPVFAVNTTTVVKGQIRDYIALSGDIIAGSTVDTYSDAAGKVTRVYVAIGDRVNRGDPIAAVDPSKPGMNYVPGIARAPISGIVTSLPAQLGMTVSQTVPLARIAGGNALEIRLYVAERFISKMAVGLVCEITLDAWPGEIFRGSVAEIAPTVDPASRTMELRVNVENPGAKLKAGMFAKVRVITEWKEDIVKIPASAMIQRFGETDVFVVEDLPPSGAAPAEQPAEKEKGFFASVLEKLWPAKDEPEKTPLPPMQQYTARKRVIKAGILIDQILEVQQGLAPDDEIVVRGQTLLEDGARINVVERVAPLSVN